MSSESGLHVSDGFLAILKSLAGSGEAPKPASNMNSIEKKGAFSRLKDVKKLSQLVLNVSRSKDESEFAGELSPHVHEGAESKRPSPMSKHAATRNLARSLSDPTVNESRGQQEQQDAPATPEPLPKEDEPQPVSTMEESIATPSKVKNKGKGEKRSLKRATTLNDKSKEIGRPNQVNRHEIFEVFPSRIAALTIPLFQVISAHREER